MNAEPSFLQVYDVQGAAVHLQLADESLIDAAVEQYITSSRTRDTLLLLTTFGGAPYKVLASQITSWHPSTPETRAQNRAVDAALAAEAQPWGDVNDG